MTRGSTPNRAGLTQLYGTCLTTGGTETSLWKSGVGSIREDLSWDSHSLNLLASAVHGPAAFGGLSVPLQSPLHALQRRWLAKYKAINIPSLPASKLLEFNLTSYALIHLGWVLTVGLSLGFTVHFCMPPYLLGSLRAWDIQFNVRLSFTTYIRLGCHLCISGFMGLNESSLHFLTTSGRGNICHQDWLQELLKLLELLKSLKIF